MNKKNFIIVSLIVLVVAVIIVVVSLNKGSSPEQGNQQTPQNEEQEASNTDAFRVEKVSDNSKKVINETRGYSFEIPQEWEVENPIPDLAGLSVYNEDASCKAITTVYDSKGLTPQQTFEAYLNKTEFPVSHGEPEVIAVSGYEGIKVFVTSGNFGNAVLGYIAVGNDIFKVSVGGGGCADPEKNFEVVLNNLQL